MKGTLIASTPRSSIQPLAVQGIPVPTCHAQIVDIVRSRLGEAHVLLFAEPVFDDTRAVTDWYTPVQGTPVPLSSLDPERQSQVRSRFAAMAEEIRSLVKPLAASGDRRRALAGEILELALRYPDANALYLVGEQPVVICWGCGPAQAGVEAQDLTRLGPVAPQAAPQAAPQVAPPPPPPAPGFAWGRILPWLLALLLALLLAGMIYGWKSGRLGTLFGAWGWTGPALSLDADVDVAGKRKADLQGEIEQLRPQLVDRRAQCVPEPLALPESPKEDDLAFLEGSWVCDTGLMDSNNVPVVVLYSFDKHGQGAIAIQSSVHGVCTGQAKASLGSGGAMHILTDTEIVCPGGASYRGQAITCTGSGAQTRCEGRNTPGNTSWEANFQRRQVKP